MRRLAIFLLALLFSLPSSAQTTTWNSGANGKSTDITLSNGNLTATAAATNTHKGVFGTQGKFLSGKWCYQFTVNAPLSDFAIGFASANWPVTNLTAFFGGTNAQPEGYSMTGLGTAGLLYYIANYFHTTVSDPPVNGQTGMVCADLDAQPPHMWITPNVAGTGGPGGGPKWNGDATANPVGDVKGFLFYLGLNGLDATLNGFGQCCIYPAFMAYNGDAVTANFGAIAFTPPTGFQTWNTVGGAPPIPGPQNDQTINAANAPGFLTSTVYHAGAASAVITTPVATPGVVHWTGHGMTAGAAVSFSEQSGSGAVFPGITKNKVYYVLSAGLAANTFEIATTPGGTPIAFTGTSSGTQLGFGLRDRFVAGPAWNGSTYTNSLDLCLWAVTTGGTSGSSASAFDTACSTGTPANYGKGLDGTNPSQWAGATTVTSGGVTATLITKIDYVTLTGLLGDDPITWTPNTPYDSRQWVVSNGRAYRINNTLFGGPNNCSTGICNPVCISAASGSGPTGTSPPLDGTCGWNDQGAITYSSRKNIWPHFLQGYYGLGQDGNPIQISNSWVVRFPWNVHMNIWYGGSGRVRYQAGQNGEVDQILAIHHVEDDVDATPKCYRLGALSQPSVGVYPPCGGPFRYYWQAAPGDSFRDNIRPGIDPLRYDETKGVAIYSDKPVVPGDNWIDHGAPISADEAGGAYVRLQMKSEFAFAAGHGEAGDIWDGNILDAGGDEVVDHCCAMLYRNNLVVSRSTNPGCMGIWSKYRKGSYSNTFVGTNTTNCSAEANQVGGGISIWQAGQSAAQSPPNYNNLKIGFPIDNAQSTDTFGATPYPYGWNDGFFSSGNATDGTPINAPGTPLFHPAPGFTSNPLLNYTAFSLGGYNNTCGASNNSPCTGLVATDVLVNPTVGPDLDATLKPNSPVKGAGANFNYSVTTIGPEAFTWYGVTNPSLTPPPTDILGTASPQ